MALEFNLPSFFQDQGVNWDSAQKCLGWPGGRRRHALQRFVDGTGRLSRDEVNDLLRYVHEHAPNWLDYIAPPNILQMMSETGRVRVYIVGGAMPEGLTDHSSLFDLLAISHINAQLPRTAWRPVRYEIEPCRMSWVAPEFAGGVLSSARSTDPPEWKLSFGSCKVNRATTLLLEKIFGPDAALPPAAEPIVFRLRPPTGQTMATTRFVDFVANEQQQGISIAGGKPFLYRSPEAEQAGSDVGLIVCQAASHGGGRVVVAGVSGPGTYAASLALVQCADLLAPKRATPGTSIRAAASQHSREPIIGVVDATVERESTASSARILKSARLVYCSASDSVSTARPITLTVPGLANEGGDTRQDHS